MQWIRGSFLMTGLLLAANGTARAQTAHTPADCDCRAAARQWQQGAETCINGEIHICGMNQNVSAWISTRRACPTAGLTRKIVRASYADSAFFSSRSE